MEIRQAWCRECDALRDVDVNVADEKLNEDTGVELYLASVICLTCNQEVAIITFET